MNKPSSSRTPVSLLIFDLDGTLVNTLEDIASSLNHTLACFGNGPLPLKAVQQYVGGGIEDLLIRSFGDHPVDLAKAVRIYKEHHNSNLVVRSVLYPGVARTLEYFQAIPKAVVSNKALEFVAPLIERLGLAGEFQALVGGGPGVLLKPSPDSIRKLVERFRVPRERTVMVGDGTTDMAAGKAAGVITCAVTYGFRSEQELLKAGPDHILHRFSELTNVFVPAK
jgi:phosphoglycolate phosphatase